MLTRNRITSSVVITLILSALAFAGVPRTINYQGYLKDTAGVPVSTPISMTFSLYSTANGAGALWSGSKSVTPVNGIYSVELGATPQPALPAFDRTYWLGVTAGTDNEMRPLQPLSSAPYALRAAVADNVNVSLGKYKYTVSGPATMLYNSSLICTCDVSSGIDCPSTFYSTTDAGALCYDVYISGGYEDYDYGWINEYSGVPYAKNSYTPLLTVGTYGGIGINTGTPMYDLDVSGTVRATKFVGDGSGVTGIAGSNVTGNISGNASNVSGTVAPAHGGTGITAVPTVAGQYLRSTGSGTWGIGSITSTDLPNLSATYVDRTTDQTILGIKTFNSPVKLASNGLAVGIYQLVVSGGNVGIGTPAPAEQLEITGNLRIPATTATTGQIMMGTSSFIHARGLSNAYLGIDAGNPSTSSPGSYNTGLGFGALTSINGGWSNVAVGRALSNLTSGDANIAIGYGAGQELTTGSWNIYLGEVTPSSASESYTMRLGDGIDETYIDGIRSTFLTGGTLVYIDPNGKLGTNPSSRRFKEEIRDMGDTTDGLMKLRPVSFYYKPEIASGPRLLQYGLIAEEVADVYPELVLYDKSGEIESVSYHHVNAMLLNEVQKQHRRIEDLEERLERLEALLNSK